MDAFIVYLTLVEIPPIHRHAYLPFASLLDTIKQKNYVYKGWDYSTIQMGSFVHVLLLIGNQTKIVALQSAVVLFHVLPWELNVKLSYLYSIYLYHCIHGYQELTPAVSRDMNFCCFTAWWEILHWQQQFYFLFRIILIQKIMFPLKQLIQYLYRQDVNLW